MKIKLLIASILSGFFITGCLTNTDINPPTGNNNQNQPAVFDFDSCVAAGNPILKSKPAQCRHNGITYVENLPTTPSTDRIKCQDAQREAEVCAEIYQPVCAKVNVQCIKAPCPPIDQTFSSACHACRNSLVESYVEGECPSPSNVD
ncbi:MAG: hypothetical protein HUU49_04495 [Candidatus Buchananbacteria bacterium]|nr:hypothetical protein [Candidatus Buchananbacteria bacterium]